MLKKIHIANEHSKYEHAAEDVRQTVNSAFYAVADVFKTSGAHASMADEAEELVAAIYHYYERSNLSGNPSSRS